MRQALQSQRCRCRPSCSTLPSPGHCCRLVARQKKEYERQRTRLERENKELEEAAARDRIAVCRSSPPPVTPTTIFRSFTPSPPNAQAFEKQESSIVAKMGTHFKDSSAAAESEGWSRGGTKSP